MTTNSLPFLLVASDLDGTLFDTNCNITDYAKRVIFRLFNEKNVKFVMATGRHHLSAVPAKNSLVQYFEQAYAGLEGSKERKAVFEKEHGFYVISSNGAVAYDDCGKILVEHSIDSNIVKELYLSYGLPYTVLKRGFDPSSDGKARPLSPSPDAQLVNGEDVANSNNGLNGPTTNEAGMDEGGLNEDPEEFSIEKVRVSAYTANEWFLTSRFLPEDLMLKKFGFIPNIIDFDPNDPRNEGKSVFDSLPLEGVHKICFRSKDRDLLHSFERELAERYGDQISVTFSSNYCLDVGPGGVSKFSALREVAEHLGIDVENVVTFGDSMNDKEMLECVGRGFVMANAQARLKRALPQCPVIGHNSDDAVAKKLEELFGLA